MYGIDKLLNLCLLFVYVCLALCEKLLIDGELLLRLIFVSDVNIILSDPVVRIR